MNNAKLAMSLSQDAPVDITPALRSREMEVAAIIEAIESITASSFWKVLDSKVLTPELTKLQRRLRNEKNPTEIYRLQGKIEQAEKFNLPDQLQVYRHELQKIRSQLNG